MIGMHYNENLQERAAVQLAAAGGGFSFPGVKCTKDGSFTNYEPISVLDTRSPSPSTSTSTSTFSSFNTTAQKGTVALTPSAAADGGGSGGGGGKEEPMAALQPPHNAAGFELTNGASENFNLGIEDFESLMSESVGQEQALLRWISSSDVDGSSLTLKQLLQAANPNEIQGNVGYFGAIDSSISPAGNLLPSLNTSAFEISGCGFSLNDNNNGKIGLFSNSLASINDNNGKKLLSVPNGLSLVNQQFGNLEQKPQIISPLDGIQQFTVQNPSNLNQFNLILDPQNATLPFLDPCNELLLRKQQLPEMQPSSVSFGQHPSFVPQMLEIVGPNNGQQHVVNDQLYKAAELIMTGNFSNAQGILARLNQVLSPVGKPFQRTAFILKEALHIALLMPPNMGGTPVPRTPTPFDGMFKMGAYKIFSEISPLVQFMNFTANQIILEALDNANEIHIIDFDIGFGAQWSSFMQELPRTRDQGMPSLKITAFASPSTHHSVELSLMHENLTQFANDLHVNFKLEVVNIDSFDPNANLVSSFRSSKNEAIVVNFPIWSIESRLSVFPSLLCFIKQIEPKILVSMDRGCDRTDLPFPRHLTNSLHFHEALLNSIEATNVNSDSINKIEKFLFQPRIESAVLGRLSGPHMMPPWRNLFASAGFFHTPISNFAETQAECVVKRSQVKGFRVEKRQASLVLCWKHHELMSVTAWRC